jgi:hypothetical protein
MKWSFQTACGMEYIASKKVWLIFGNKIKPLINIAMLLDFTWRPSSKKCPIDG